MDRMTISTLIL